MNPSSQNSRARVWSLVRWLAAVVFVVGVVRTAWIAEDAFITFRTIDNFFNGFGLRWNVAERVQTYSHPLWMMALSVGRGISGEYYYSALVVGASCSALAVYALAFRLPCSIRAGACCLLVLAFSKSFVDYSTSGLEGPLTHLLLAIFAMLHFGGLPARKRLFWMTLVGSLAVVNRADTALLFFPALLIACRGIALKDCVRPLVLGGLPLAAWVAFATLYYGTPIPVTGYAKAMTGIDSGEMFSQGVQFYKDVATRDPILLPVLGLGLLVAFANRSVKGFGLALGALLYCAYLLKIGGGYMAGRFLTPPFFLAAILLVRTVVSERLRWVYPVSVVATLILGFLSPSTPLLSGPDFSTRSLGHSDSGIIDERGSWYLRTGLLAKTRDIPKPNALPEILGLQLDPADPLLFLDGLVGLDGLLAGPGVHFVDPMLCDPLLMRLPAWDIKNWRIGHFLRRVPAGYLESVALGKNKFNQVGLARAYDDVRLLTRGKLFRVERFAAMWSLAFGEGRQGLRDYAQHGYRDLSEIQVKHSDFPGPCAEGTPVWSEAFHLVSDGGLVVSLGAVSHTGRLNLGLGGLAEYRITFLKAGEVLASVTHYAGEKSKLFPGVVPAQIEVPEGAIESGFDTLRINDLRKRRSGIHCVAYITLP